MTLDITSRIRRLTVTSLVVAALLAGSAPQANAAENESFSVFPTSDSGDLARSFFVFDLVPGVVVTDIVSVANKTDTEVTLDLYATDALPTSDGSFALLEEDGEQESIGSWITLPSDEVTIPPQTEAQIPFSLSVPDVVEPGDHTGGIVALNRAVGETVGTDDRAELNVQAGVGARVYARVAGDLRPDMEITSISVAPDRSIGTAFGASGTVDIQYTILNTGNIRIVPIVSAKVSGPFGLGERTAADRTLPDLLPGGSVTIREEVTGVRPWVRLTADVEARSPDGEGVVTGTGTALFAPWILFVILAIVIAEILRRRRNRVKEPVPDDEELVER